MAVLRQGSVISATVEQSLGNCLLVYFKHRSRTFRGVLFDEKNSVVPRTSISKQSDDQKLMSNKSSLPLGMAVVSPSKQPYSSLRNRIYFNTTSKRPGGSNSRVSVSKSSETKGSLLAHSGATGKDSLNSREGSSHSHTTASQDGLSELDTRHSSRLLRQRCKISTVDGNGLKRKAESELVGTKPSKSRSNVKQHTTSVVNWDSSKNVYKSQRKATTSKSTKRKVMEVAPDSNSKSNSTDNLDKILPCGEQSGISTAGSNENSTEIMSTLSTTSVRQNLFPPENDLKTNVFSNDQSEIQGISNEGCINRESDEVAEFFGSLGLGSACHDRDDNSVSTDSGTSYSSAEQLGERSEFPQERQDNLNYDESELIMDLHTGEYEGKNEESCSKQLPLTPAKKSARISAKRAILEQNMTSYDDNTIWSIWGGLPTQKQKESQYSSSDSHVQVDSPESLAEVVDVDTSSSVDGSKSLPSTVRVKGARMKQTPVRAKKISNNLCVPEKQVSVGNIVWGKVHGHPWWPGRVLAVSGNFGEGTETTKHAHVTWFGSNTSSIMPVNELQHFVSNFSRRHKKAKRGCYRKAVKQAQDMLQIMGEEI